MNQVYCKGLLCSAKRNFFDGSANFCRNHQFQLEIKIEKLNYFKGNLYNYLHSYTHSSITARIIVKTSGWLLLTLCMQKKP